ncbi:helix-turn-helix domain-containing protein [Paenibacillus sp. HJL G12]|uniref:Helix-turn-helix domain-containing protein n=1 Tax=Paenibacillus dendrobii TaxID=2691084 RepID=A0A7X3IGH8_9BACL|nr:helix-turn-helix domain-containing protein [Paenibacillus dendrobii]MWV43001.1 helix-turn-helix domain-containing protein [Paenibacillus dendrobii]
MINNFPYDIMVERQDALERLDLKVYWGTYEIRVLRFHFVTFPSGKMVTFHKHAEYEFHFIPRGKGKVILEDEPFALREGMLYLTGPGVMHYQEADAAEAMDELCLHVDIVNLADKEKNNGKYARHGADPWEMAEAHDCMEKLTRLPLRPVMDTHRAMPFFLEAYQASQMKYAGLYTTIKHCVIQILLRAVRAYESEPMEAMLPARDMKAYRYQLALEYMQANSSGEVILDDVADKLHISTRQLQRIIKEMGGGHSFSAILEDIRLQAVCRRLVETKEPMDTIARLEGFSSGSYLHTVFRKRIGMTPTEYRNLNTSI